MLFGLVAALVKFIAMDPYVVLQLRDTLQCLFSLAAVSAFVPAGTTTDKLFGEPRHRMILFVRSGLYWGFMALFWMALDSMPVGDATTIVYCSPLFTALFGWLLLGEQVSLSVFGCLALSMVGVSLITQPGFLFGGGSDKSDEYNRGMLYAFSSALLGGLLPVLVRKSKECHWATVNHVAALCSSVVFTPAAIAVRMALKHVDAPGNGPGMWDGIEDPNKLLMIGLMALVGFAGLGLQTYGYQREQAARASAMCFLEIPFSYVLQYFMFRDLLAPVQGLGMILVVVSGLLNLKPAESSDSVQESKEPVPFCTSPNLACQKLSTRGAQRHKSNRLYESAITEEQGDKV